MRIEYEFYFRGGGNEEVCKHFAIHAMDAFIHGNTTLGKIGKVEVLSLNDWEWGDDGAFCCFELEGDEKDLKYLVFNNAGILDDTGEQIVHWETCVEKLI